MITGEVLNKQTTDFFLFFLNGFETRKKEGRLISPSRVLTLEVGINMIVCQGTIAWFSKTQ